MVRRLRTAESLQYVNHWCGLDTQKLTLTDANIISCCIQIKGRNEGRQGTTSLDNRYCYPHFIHEEAEAHRIRDSSEVTRLFNGKPESPH